MLPTLLSVAMLHRLHAMKNELTYCRYLGKVPLSQGDVRPMGEQKWGLGSLASCHTNEATWEENL